MAKMGKGPYAEYEVVPYTGSNQFKQGTVFCPDLGIRLNADTGEPVPDSLFVEPIRTAVLNAATDTSSLEKQVADLTQKLEEAMKAIEALKPPAASKEPAAKG